MESARDEIAEFIAPRPVAELDLKGVADIIRDMSGSWRPELSLHDCDMEVEVGTDGRLRFLFFRKEDRRSYLKPSYAKAR